MKRLLISSFALLIFWAVPAKSQSYIQNTMYMFNRTVYNPGSVGASGGSNFTLMGRTQWVGIEGSPRLVTTAFDLPMKRVAGGLGGYIIGDQLGPLSTVGVNLAYAYHWHIGSDYGDNSVPVLQVGVQGGFLQKAINGVFRYNQDIWGPDPLIGFNEYAAAVMVPNLGAGIYLRGPDNKYYVGISGQDLLEPSIEGLVLSNIGPQSKVPRTFYLMGGYSFDVGNDILIQPNVLARTEGASFQFDVGANVNLQSAVFGISHRWQDSFSAIMGYKVSDRVFVGYAYDYTISGLNTYKDVHSHELIINYNLPSAETFNRPTDNVKDRPPGSGL